MYIKLYLQAKRGVRANPLEPPPPCLCAWMIYVVSNAIIVFRPNHLNSKCLSICKQWETGLIYNHIFKLTNQWERNELPVAPVQKHKQYGICYLSRGVIGAREAHAQFLNISIINFIKSPKKWSSQNQLLRQCSATRIGMHFDLNSFHLATYCFVKPFFVKGRVQSIEGF